MHRSRSLQLGLYTTFLLYAAPLGFLTYWVSFGEEQSDCTLTPYRGVRSHLRYGDAGCGVNKSPSLWVRDGGRDNETDRAALKSQQVRQMA